MAHYNGLKRSGQYGELWIPRQGWHLIECPGEAHRTVYIDHCGLCAPLWGKVSVPEFCATINEYRDFVAEGREKTGESFNVERAVAVRYVAGQRAMPKHDPLTCPKQTCRSAGLRGKS